MLCLDAADPGLPAGHPSPALSHPAAVAHVAAVHLLRWPDEVGAAENGLNGKVEN